MYKYLLFIGLTAGFIFVTKAQTPYTTPPVILKSNIDTLRPLEQDTNFLKSKKAKIRKEKVYHTDTAHSPRVAVIRSLIVPGWGQVYNHKTWKVPLVYGGLLGLGWAYVYNARNYTTFLAL